MAHLKSLKSLIKFIFVVHQFQKDKGQQFKEEA